MYVCVCNAVTERQIRQAVKEGATTVKHLKEQLGVGTDCGSCASCAKACIKEALAAQSGQQVHFTKQSISISPIQLGVV